jgi:hypothetical protein
MAACADVGADDDTLSDRCLLCAARSSVDAALVRAGAEQVTIVIRYRRPRVGRSALEGASAIVAFLDGSMARGEGDSREEAILEALHAAGVVT